MRTEAKEYSEYLQRKYLPGRSLYLRWVFYPKLFRHFPAKETIIDLGCGTGEFLNFCRSQGRHVLGIDSNPTLVEKNIKAGFEVVLDNICTLPSLGNQKFKYAVCDNVLEHLEAPQIHKFFLRTAELLASGGVLVCIVPGVKGFQMDPTHKTFISQNFLKEACRSAYWTIQSYYHHPFDARWVGKFLYLNMQVFKIHRL